MAKAFGIGEPLSPLRNNAWDLGAGVHVCHGGLKPYRQPLKGDTFLNRNPKSFILL
jgi:hypothetical protein